ncbi:MAG: hypothetical protein ABL886_03005, partial [Rhodoglobus sp.]
MRKITMFAGLGLATALALTGCSAATTAEAPADDDMSSMIEDTVNSDGAGLRAAIQAALYDHVYLAAAAIDQALQDG